ERQRDGPRRRPAHWPQPAAVHPGLHGRNRTDAETLLSRATVSKGNGPGKTDHSAGLGSAGGELRVFRPIAPDPRLSHVLGPQPHELSPPTEPSPSAGRAYQTQPLATIPLGSTFSNPKPAPAVIMARV